MRRVARVGSIVVSLLATSAGCGGAQHRFALAPPHTTAIERPFSPAPAKDEEYGLANSLDVSVLRPISRVFLLERSHEALDVGALDEVLDSSWFSNRSVGAAELARGPCVGMPAAPYTLASSKSSGSTPGFVATDLLGRRYVLKVDDLGPRQPEISTAADVIVSRLYWAAGFNVPCNVVIEVDPESELQIAQHAYDKLPTGEKTPLTRARLREILERATKRGDRVRLSASQFIEGRPVGTWRTEGTRKDDPNDRIPHEDRRELRGERLLAAWTAHWDSRGPNSFDSYVRDARGGGLVVHYFLDFSDALGGTIAALSFIEPRLGHTGIVSLPQIFADLFALGLAHDSWEDLRLDPNAPNLGYFDVDHFEPLNFSPEFPLVRWERADAADLGWMARRIARIERAHVEEAVRAGKLSSAREEARLVDVLMGRRERILRAAFAKSSPLADVAIEGRERLCMTDLDSRSHADSPAAFAFVLTRGTSRVRAMAQPTLEPLGAAGRVCASLPPPAMLGSEGDDSPARYAVIDVVRVAGGVRTTLRVHAYDLGERGYVLAGIERPDGA
jgi:hypothetical protein